MWNAAITTCRINAASCHVNHRILFFCSAKFDIPVSNPLGSNFLQVLGVMLITSNCIGTHHLFCVEVTSPGLYMYIQGLQSMIPIPLHSGAGAVGTGGSAGGPKPSGIQPRRPLEQVTCFKVHYNLVHITTL